MPTYREALETLQTLLRQRQDIQRLQDALDLCQTLEGRQHETEEALRRLQLEVNDLVQQKADLESGMPALQQKYQNLSGDLEAAFITKSKDLEMRYQGQMAAMKADASEYFRQAEIAKQKHAELIAGQERERKLTEESIVALRVQLDELRSKVKNLLG